MAVRQKRQTHFETHRWRLQRAGLSDLIIEQANSYELNIRIFNRLQHTISGWPGGKPNADDSKRPERALPAKNRWSFSARTPMMMSFPWGGTFQRLVDQGHEVHVAYQNLWKHSCPRLRCSPVCRVYAWVWRNRKKKSGVTRTLKTWKDRQLPKQQKISRRGYSGSTKH